MIGGVMGNKSSADEARKNRQFQRKMYKHRYQYTVEDMRRAGLNPALAYEQGGGSAPSGSSAQQDNPFSGASRAAGAAVSTALEVQLNRAQIENIRMQTAKTEVEKNQLLAEGPSRAAWWGYRPGETAQHTGLMGHQAAVASATAAYLEETFRDRVTVAGLERQEAEKVLVELQQEIELRGLDRAPLQAQADFAKSYVGKYVAPAMGSAQGAAGIVAAIVNMFVQLRQRQGSDSRSGKPNRARMRP